MTQEKEFITETRGNLYYLRWAGGGEMPEVLKGMYTSEQAALKAGEDYKAARKPKRTTSVKKNAKNNAREK